MKSTYLDNAINKLCSERERIIEEKQRLCLMDTDKCKEKLIKPVDSKIFFNLSLIVSFLPLIALSWPGYTGEFMYTLEMNYFSVIMLLLDLSISIALSFIIVKTYVSGGFSYFLFKTIDKYVGMLLKRIGIKGKTISLIFSLADMCIIVYSLAVFSFSLFYLIYVRESSIGFLFVICNTICFALNYKIRSSCGKTINKKNQVVADEVKEIEASYEKQYASIREEYEIKMQNERDSYNDKVKKAIETYCQSDVMEPIVKWLSNSLQAKISAAEKDSFVKYIEATIAYRVEEKEIELLEIMPHSNEYKSVSVFNFYQNRFYDEPDFFKRVGLAKVLSKLIEIEIKKRDINELDEKFQDSSTITIDNNDTFVEINYKVLNPSYRAPVKIEG